ncbi:MAG TPA: ATP-binding protein [Acidobacteriota bacterium]|nr:ATP-binding protein [Acidobacteriota bacterium]
MLELMGLRFPWRKSRQGRDRAALREFVTGLAGRALGILEPSERRAFMQAEIEKAFGFTRAEILIPPEGSERFSSESTRVRDILSRILGILEGTRKPYLNDAIAREVGVSALLKTLGATHVFPIEHGQNRLGLLLIDSSPRSKLDSQTEATIQTLCAQLSLVLENSALLKAKLELQSELSQQAQMVQLGEMTARIAHEIKNPLSSIKTIVQVMQEDLDLKPGYAKDLELINGEIDRLKGSISQLLNFARPGQQAREKVFLRDAAESALSFLRRDIEQQEFYIEDDVPSDLPPIEGNPTALREIFLNLFLNSLQAGGPATRIRLQAWEGALADGSERYLLLVVEDDGPGIPQELQSRVFVPFFTTRQKGTGLGLAIVKRNVEHMGGRISLESPVREGRGTRFLMHLPLSG